MILVDLDVPDGVALADLRAPLERWGQMVRHAAMEGAPGVSAGDVSGCVLPMPSDDVVAILKAIRVR